MPLILNVGKKFLMNKAKQRGDLPETMRAVVLARRCDPEDLRVTQVALPHMRQGWVLVKVKAFGLNRSELMLRAEEVDEDYINSPIIPGIECVGIVVDAGNTRFKKDEPVVALMGGMGRNFDGSYAEYVLLPEKQVFSVDGLVDQMGWDEIAAIPETWFTAWGSLFTCLRIRPEENLLIRGGTSALGLAALQIAQGIGCSVAATTRKPDRVALLKSVGAKSVFVDDETLSSQVKDRYPNGFDCILELVGPKRLMQSFRFANNPGRVCMSGILSKPYTLSNFDPIKDIPNGVSLSGFFSNYPDQTTITELFSFINKHAIHPFIAARYSLDEIGEAHRAMENSELVGKAVVIV